jgi:type II secretory ATPase GspE/PulE/Tfp pilus assembly ATPase PilB-like protein
MREAIGKGASGNELRAHALRLDMPTLRDGAIEAMRLSETIPEEVARHRL